MKLLEENDFTDSQINFACCSHQDEVVSATSFDDLVQNLDLKSSDSLITELKYIWL